MKLRSFFENWQDTIIDSCLSGIMGEIITDETQESAAAFLGDFCFLTGKPYERIIRDAAQKHGSGEMILAVRDDGWSECIETSFSGRFSKEVRYAIAREGNVFNRDRLCRAVKSLPAGYTMRCIDKELYDQCLQQAWCRDFVSQYQDWPMFERLGLGVVALWQGEIVAGASSYSRYSQGIEIEVDTRDDHRRKGLAYACSAALILACLDRGLYPNWDAANRASVALAEKLGYHFDHEYPVWILQIG